MHAFATDGSQPNNDEFSPQSIGYIDPVIADRGQSPGKRIYHCDCSRVGLKCFDVV